MASKASGAWESVGVQGSGGFSEQQIRVCNPLSTVNNLAGLKHPKAKESLESVRSLLLAMGRLEGAEALTAS